MQRVRFLIDLGGGLPGPFSMKEMNKEELQQYMDLVDEVLQLQVQKEEFHKKVIQNYGTYNADIYMKRISGINKTVEEKMNLIQELKKKNN